MDIKIKVRDARRIYSAMVPISHGDTAAQNMSERAKLGLAINFSVLHPICQQYEKQEREILEEVTAKEKDAVKRQTEVERRREELLDTDIEVKLQALKRADFRIEENPSISPVSLYNMREMIADLLEDLPSDAADTPQNVIHMPSRKGSKRRRV